MDAEVGTVNSCRTSREELMTGTITLENGVKVTGLGELSYGLAFTQIIVRTVDQLQFPIQCTIRVRFIRTERFSTSVWLGYKHHKLS
jgi:hypothetical protein